MGIMFRGNTTSIGVEELDLPVLEGYGCSDGYLLSMADCLYNEGVDFNDSMSKEFNEVVMEMKKSNLEEKGLFTESASIEILTESASDIIEKLKYMVKKLASKINNIYETVKLRIMSFLTRDYNKFYNANKDKFNKNYKNFKGNIKWMQPKRYYYMDINDVYTDFYNIIIRISNKTLDEYEEYIKNEYLCEILSEMTDDKVTDVKDFKKIFKNTLFEKEKIVEGVSDKIAEEVIKILKGKDIITYMDKIQKQNKNGFNKIINSLNIIYKQAKNGEKGEVTVTSQGDTIAAKINPNEHGIRAIELIKKSITLVQTACNMINGEYISLTKSHIAQCKAVFTKVCASATVSEQTLLDSLEECVYDEVIEELEAV